MSDTDRDDYLFDPAAPPDPAIVRIEERLRAFRYRDVERRVVGGGPRDAAPDARRRFMFAAVAAAALIAVATWRPWEGEGVPQSNDGAPHGPALKSDGGFQVETLAGAPGLGSGAGDGLLLEGERLRTDASSRARVALAAGGRTFGHVDVEPSSSLRLIRASENEQRFALDRGEIRALTWAPPRLLFIETPSATAVDLGCAYVLKVDDAGHGLLSVTSGSVALETDGVESYVPRGASCATRVGRGPGTPRFDDAPEDLKAALDRFDFADGGEAALREVVNSATRPRDSLTLFHLLARTNDAARRDVCLALMKLAPPQDGASDEAVASALRLDPTFLAAWRAALRAHW